MKFEDTALKDAYLIHVEKNYDARGFFARSFCSEEFKSRGIDFSVEQCNVSFNFKKGTLRGMHYQKREFSEAKLVRCTMGAIYDVLIDLRINSPTYLSWKGFYLDGSKHNALYIPEGYAHGFQTIEDNTEVFYQMSTPYNSLSACGLRWNDAVFNIDWPDKNPIISDRDATYPDYIP